MGSVTTAECNGYVGTTFQLTRSVGSVTGKEPEWVNEQRISTHTLRGERDEGKKFVVTVDTISTHTLRGERDYRLCV